jgi:hypothetical protein
MRFLASGCDDRPCRTSMISSYSGFITLESSLTVCVCLAPCKGYPLVFLERLDNQVRPDNAILTESVSSHANCLKTRTAKRPTTTAPTYVVGDRVHAVLGSNLLSGIPSYLRSVLSSSTNQRSSVPENDVLPIMVISPSGLWSIALNMS